MAGLMLDWLAASNPQPQKNLTWPEDLSKKQQHAADVLKTGRHQAVSWNSGDTVTPVV